MVKILNLYIILFFTHLYHTSFQYLPITCNAFIACDIKSKTYLKYFDELNIRSLGNKKQLKFQSCLFNSSSYKSDKGMGGSLMRNLETSSIEVETFRYMDIPKNCFSKIPLKICRTFSL